MLTIFLLLRRMAGRKENWDVGRFSCLTKVSGSKCRVLELTSNTYRPVSIWIFTMTRTSLGSSFEFVDQFFLWAAIGLCNCHLSGQMKQIYASSLRRFFRCWKVAIMFPHDMSCKLVRRGQIRLPSLCKNLNWESTFRNGEISHKNVYLVFLEIKLREFSDTELTFLMV